MLKEPTTYLRLPTDVRQMARLSAAAADQTLSAYVADLIRSDAQRTGIAALIQSRAEEVAR